MGNLQELGNRLQHILNLELFTIHDVEIHIINLVYMLIILVMARFMVFLFRKYLNRKKSEGKLDTGKVYAIGQVTAYFIYVIAIVMVIDSFGFKITVLLAGSTALLVGIGLGLQDFFRDMVAGFIILFERVVTAGDIVEITGTVGQVKEVGLRTTSLITREDMVIIVPNTKLTTEQVVNWSQNKKVTRFRVDVGVAYGSNTQLVKQILIDCAKNHPDVVNVPEPNVLFRDFGDSALNFSVFFFSKNLFRIEVVKSDLRFAIDQAFREKGITIPFPQRDVWFKNTPDNTSLPQ